MGVINLEIQISHEGTSLYRAGSTAECPAASAAPSGLKRAGCRLLTDNP
jgi:hypothetical protein